jgi:hypothetical protein
MDRLREHIKISDRTGQQGRPELTAACPHVGYDSACASRSGRVMAAVVVRRPAHGDAYGVQLQDMRMGCLKT